LQWLIEDGEFHAQPQPPKEKIHPSYRSRTLMRVGIKELKGTQSVDYNTYVTLHDVRFEKWRLFDVHCPTRSSAWAQGWLLHYLER
jgi:hypothetical protein